MHVELRSLVLGQMQAFYRSKGRLLLTYVSRLDPILEGTDSEHRVRPLYALQGHG